MNILRYIKTPELTFPFIASSLFTTIPYQFLFSTWKNIVLLIYSKYIVRTLKFIAIFPNAIIDHACLKEMFCPIQRHCLVIDNSDLDVHPTVTVDANGCQCQECVFWRYLLC